MSVSKLIIAGVFTVSSLGLTTAAYAQESVSCLDGSVENGDCIERRALNERDQAGTRGSSNNGSSQESSDNDDD